MDNQQQPEVYTKAKKCALGLLAMREHSGLELKCKLAERGIDTKIIAKVLLDLGNSGFQSDERFAEFYVKNRAERGYGPLRIEGELRDRGIAQELIRRFLDKNSEAWKVNAKKVHDKKFGAQMPQDHNEKLKQMQFLQYRGFGVEQVKEIINFK